MCVYNTVTHNAIVYYVCIVILLQCFVQVRNALVEQSDLKKELKQKNTMVEEEER